VPGAAPATRRWLVLCAQDAHTDDKGELSVDRQQDYVLDLVHVTSAGSLVVEFHRQFDTCDNDDYLIDVRAVLFFSRPRSDCWPHQRWTWVHFFFTQPNPTHDANAKTQLNTPITHHT